MVAPAVVVDGVGGDVGRPVAVLSPGLAGHGAPAERSAAHLTLDALIGEAVLHLERERAAERIESVDRIVGNERHALDGHFRDQVPVDRVAEHFVDAHPVLINRDALRRSQHRRGGKSPVIQVELERVAGLVAQRDAGQMLRDRLEQVRRFCVVEIGRGQALHVCRNLVAVEIGRRQRRGFDDFDGRQLDGTRGSLGPCRGGHEHQHPCCSDANAPRHRPPRHAQLGTMLVDAGRDCQSRMKAAQARRRPARAGARVRRRAWRGRRAIER